MTTSDEPPLLSIDQLAAFLSVPRHTLDQWSYLGTGPPYYKVGRHRRYSPADVEAWLDQRRRDVSRGQGCTRDRELATTEADG